MDPIARRVAERFSFKYVPKEKKQHKVDRLMKAIRDATGVSRGIAEDIADAIVRKRNLSALAVQKNWPVENGVVEGPSGTLDLSTLSM